MIGGAVRLLLHIWAGRQEGQFRGDTAAAAGCAALVEPIAQVIMQRFDRAWF